MCKHINKFIVHSDCRIEKTDVVKMQFDTIYSSIIYVSVPNKVGKTDLRVIQSYNRKFQKISISKKIYWNFEVSKITKKTYSLNLIHLQHKFSTNKILKLKINTLRINYV